MNKIIEKILSQSQLSRQEAWWLLEWATGKSKEQLLTGHNELSEEIILKIDAAVKKIDQESMPLAYVIGHVPFGDLTIDVQAPILIPRPETEEWVYRLIEKLQPEKEKISTILDLGTGSGCIALALAHAFPRAHVTASDINPRALELAKQNARKNGINNICFIESDLFKNIAQKSFDLIVSNPPYIAHYYQVTLSDSVINWEDHRALFAPKNGLELIEKIIEQLPNRLSHQNISVQFAIECDPEQIETIIALCSARNLTAYPIIDAFDNQRAVWGFAPPRTVE
jgi:release factor glutamine methyltransferase